MIAPRPGLRCFHDGVPLEMLYIVTPGVDGARDVWRCRRIFVEAAEFDRAIGAGDRITPLHTQDA